MHYTAAVVRKSNNDIKIALELEYTWLQVYLRIVVGSPSLLGVVGEATSCRENRKHMSQHNTMQTSNNIV